MGQVVYVVTVVVPVITVIQCTLLSLQEKNNPSFVFLIGRMKGLHGLSVHVLAFSLNMLKLLPLSCF